MLFYLFLSLATYISLSENILTLTSDHQYAKNSTKNKPSLGSIQLALSKNKDIPPTKKKREKERERESKRYKANNKKDIFPSDPFSTTAKKKKKSYLFLHFKISG